MRNRWWSKTTVLALGAGLLVGGGTLTAWASRSLAQACPPVSTTERVSAGNDGAPANDRSVLPAINADGCVVGFKSYASNLVAGDTNDKVDVFVRDRSAGTTERIPNTPFTETNPKDNSYPPGLDASGTIVGFGSLSNNLTPGDFNQLADLFVYDRAAHVTEILTLAQDGEGGGNVPDLPPTLSRDGRFVAFTSGSDKLVSGDKNQTNDVFVYDRDGHTRELISLTTTGSEPGTAGNGPSAGGAIDADGCQVAFYSDASNIVPFDTNQHRDVFVRDRCAGTTERVSVTSDGSQANADSEASGFLPGISADGNLVAFSSDATNLDPADDNGTTDIFVRDRGAGTTTRVSKRQTGESANGPSQYPAISGDGRFVVFQSAADNLVDGDTNGRVDVFVVEIASGAVRRVSLTSAGEQANGDSTAPQISTDGGVITFQSDATNLVDGDTNGATDIFVVSNPLSGTPTPTPTAGDFCGSVCAEGQGCRRVVEGEVQPGECVPALDCECIVGGTPTPTPTAGDSCGDVCTEGQGCRRIVGGEVQPGECVPALNCECVVGGTPTPTPTPSRTAATATPTPTVTPTLTPTAGDFCNASCSTGQTCRRDFGGDVVPGVCRPDLNCECVIESFATPTATRTSGGGSPTPTRTQTAAPHKGGGGGGGCGCRIDPATGKVADVTPLSALLLPAALWLLRRRAVRR